MQKEDGRVTIHGWSLPSKHKVGAESVQFGFVELDLTHSFQESSHLMFLQYAAQLFEITR